MYVCSFCMGAALCAPVFLFGIADDDGIVLGHSFIYIDIYIYI